MNPSQGNEFELLATRLEALDRQFNQAKPVAVHCRE
jgi:hypothetical protein